MIDRKFPHERETLVRPAANGTAFWRPLFGNDAPVEIEIGSGDGAFLTAVGARFPTRNFLGIERSPAKARRLAARIARLAPANVRILQADAVCIVTSILPAESVAAYHVYFPDPWPKRAHANRRIFGASFAAALARTIAPGGRLFVATDVRSYAVTVRQRILEVERFREVAEAEDHPGLATSFARKYRAAGLELYAYTFARLGVPASRSSAGGVEDEVDVVAEVHSDEIDRRLVTSPSVDRGAGGVATTNQDGD